MSSSINSWRMVIEGLPRIKKKAKMAMVVMESIQLRRLDGTQSGSPCLQRMHLIVKREERISMP